MVCFNFFNAKLTQVKEEFHCTVVIIECLFLKHNTKLFQSLARHSGVGWLSCGDRWNISRFFHVWSRQFLVFKNISNEMAFNLVIFDLFHFKASI